MTNLFKCRRYNKQLKRLVNEKAVQGEPLSVMNDLVFKAMLTSDSEDSREALRSLLSACTRRPVSNVRITNNDLVPPHLNAKAVKVDVHVTFNDGETAVLEMQISKTDDDIKARAELYAAMLLSAQSQKGRKYKEIKRVYQIFFLNCVLFPDSDKLPRRYSYREEKEYDRLSDITEIIFYEMPKLERKVRNILAETEKIKDLSEEEKWCIFMRYRHEKRAAKLVEKLYREEEGIMWAEKAVNGIDRDYLKFARKMAETKGRWEREQRIYMAEKEGMEKGMEKGMAQGLEKGMAQGRTDEKLEIVQKMKVAGRPLAEIIEFTGLSLEEIKKIKNS
jgi:predicted transposase/invertase (TIGR01784 family)